jgi:hypothetical protein
MNVAPVVIRFPDPAPIQSDYPDLTKKQWQSFRAKWYQSTPRGKAKIKVWRKTPSGIQSKRKSASKYWKSEGGHAYGLEAARRRTRKLAEALVAFRHSISVDGHCAYKDLATGEYTCRITARDCDLHHRAPKEIYPVDGLPRKKKTLSHCSTYTQLLHEIERNTAEDGTLLLDLLCPKHHAEITFTGDSMNGERKRRWMAVALIKIATRVCQYENCSHPEDECTMPAHSFFFHYDHFFTANDRDVPEDKRRIEMISVMIAYGNLYTMEDILAEIAKCRLVHADCHRIITR